MKSTKKVMALVFSIVFLLSLFSQTVFASEDVEDIEEIVSNITDEVEIIDIDELPDGTPILHFATMEEFNEAMKQWNEFQESKIIEEKLYEDKTEIQSRRLISHVEPSPFAVTSSSVTVRNGADRIQWSSTERWDFFYKLYLPYNMYIDFTYTYSGLGSTRQFLTIKSVKSHSSGFPSTWHQTSYAANISSDKKSVSIKIQGYHLLGVKVGDQAVGAKFSDAYTKSFKF
jgi:hypothetical protein